ncbi:MAG: hypothetical protein JXB49_15865 [Bacteroidales bacterium]|nr:hypothetical protein [Bacteroidales bacterium]
MLSIFPNSTIIADERVQGIKGINLFTRYFFGIVSIWDLLMLMLLTLSVFYKRRLSLIVKQKGVNRFLLPIFAILIFAMFNGLFKATIFPYGLTNFRNVVQAVLPSLYFFGAYFLSIQIIRHKDDFSYSINVLYTVCLIILAIGLMLMIASLVGFINITKGFLGIPIVLYDQLMFLNLAVGFIFVKAIVGQKQNIWHWIIFAFSIFFMFLSTRRLVLIILFFNMFGYFIFACYSTRWRILNKKLVFKLTKIFISISILLPVITFLFVPQLWEAMGMVIESINVFSEVGLKYAGNSRLAELSNVFLNMNQRPESYFIGMGLGTQFFEYIPMGYDILGDTAYDAAVMEKSYTGWFPYFHIPGISNVYRFGFCGVVLFCILICSWLYGWVKISRNIDKTYLPYVITISILSAETILFLGDSVNSMGPAFSGIILALLNFCYQQKTCDVKIGKNKMSTLTMS